MRQENLKTLREKLDHEIDCLLEEDPSILQAESSWDMELSPEEITIELAREMMKMEPVGQGNPKPVFLLRNIKPAQVRFMGSDSTHAKFNAESENGKRAECVLFQKAQEKRELLCGGDLVDIIGIIELQKWNGRERVQFIVEEIIKCK